MKRMFYIFLAVVACSCLVQAQDAGTQVALADSLYAKFDTQGALNAYLQVLRCRFQQLRSQLENIQILQRYR